MGADPVVLRVVRGQRLYVARAILEAEEEPTAKLALVCIHISFIKSALSCQLIMNQRRRASDLVARASDARAAADHAVAAALAALAFAQVLNVSLGEGALPVRAVVGVRVEAPSSLPNADESAALRDCPRVVVREFRLLSGSRAGSICNRKTKCRDRAFQYDAQRTLQTKIQFSIKKVT